MKHIMGHGNRQPTTAARLGSQSQMVAEGDGVIIAREQGWDCATGMGVPANKETGDKGIIYRRTRAGRVVRVGWDLDFPTLWVRALG